MRVGTDMDNYNRYIIDLVLQSRIDSANGSTGSSSVEEPSANLQSSSDGFGWTIDKTYADLQALQAKGTLTSLAWHREDGTVVTVPLTSTGPVDGKDAFVFSTIITTADGSTFNAFILDEDDVLTYITEDIGGGGGGVDTSFKVVGLKDGHPDVTSPSKKIIYLTKDSGSTATDPYTEWIYTTDNEWAIIGETSVDLSGYKTKQTAKTDPSASGTQSAFIATITQNENGEITATKANMPQASTTAAGIVQLGSGATNAAPGNHTHTTEIASDSGSPTVNLEADTTYRLTAGGTSVVFKTPSAEASADEKVKATAKTDNVAYPLMAVASSSPTSGDATEAVYGASVTLNPSTNTIAANISGDAATASDVKAGSTLATTIGGKANKVSNATEGDIATLDSNGNLVDSGVSTSDFATSAQGTKADSAIQGVSAGGTPLTPDANKVVNIPNAVASGSAEATDGLMTSADKFKLNGIQAGAQVNTIETITVDNGSALPITNANVNIDLSGKVDVVQGKGLSTNDFTTADKDIVDNAGEVIPSDATVQNQLVSQSTLTAALANFGGFKVVPGDSTTGEPVLPSGETASTKIIYLVKDSSATGPDLYKEWIWDEGDSSATPPVAAHWELIGDTSMDLSGYVELPSIHTDTHLVTFGPNNDIVDSGKTVAQLENAVTTLSIGGGSAISPTSGTTNINIPLATNSNGTGSSGAMSGADKVKLDGIATGAEVNVQADWEETNALSDAYILNKPSLINLSAGAYISIIENGGNLEIGCSGVASSEDLAAVSEVIPTSASSSNQLVTHQEFNDALGNVETLLANL